MEGYNDSHVNYELLGRYLGGECTPAETRQVEEWLAASPDNARILEELRNLWEKAADQEKTGVDVDAAWQRVHSHIRGSSGTTIRPPFSKSPAMWFIRIAAAFFVVVCVGLVLTLNYYRHRPETTLRTFTSGDLPVTDTLPDGSVVTLNAHSKLEYPEKFAGKERLVTLQGEAYFDVAHDPAHPFRIHAGAADVRVLGTSFHLNARSDQVKVAVQTGKVELSQADSTPGTPRPRIVLTAGMAARYDSKARKILPEAGDVENELFWKTKRLVFRNEPLAEVVAVLNATLGDSIVLDSEAIRDCPLTTTFDQPSIASALDVIAKTFNLEVIQDGHRYILTGSGCH
jgi:transmembrane sensor